MASGMFVYVSNAGDGDIAAFRLDPVTGDLEPVGRAPAGPRVMPMALSPDGGYLYAVVRGAPCSVVTYGIDRDSGRLDRLATAPLAGDMVYAAVDAAGRFLFTASYNDDLIAINPIDVDGVVRRGAGQVIRTGRHAHAVRPDPANRFLYATTLGDDRILQFRFDPASGLASPNDPAFISTRAGSGPRHIEFSPDGRCVYILTEMAGTVIRYLRTGATGTLSPAEAISAVPPEARLVPGRIRAAGRLPKPDQCADWIWGADIHATPDGRFLYASERTSSRIACFAVDAGFGGLTLLRSSPAETQPRGFAIDPGGRFLVAAGEASGHVAVYAIDPGNGDLAPLSRAPAGAGANWVVVTRQGA